MMITTKKIRQRAVAYMVISFLLASVGFIGAMLLAVNGHHGTAGMWVIMATFSLLIYWKSLNIYRSLENK